VPQGSGSFSYPARHRDKIASSFFAFGLAAGCLWRLFPIYLARHMQLRFHNMWTQPQQVTKVKTVSTRLLMSAQNTQQSTNSKTINGLS